MLINFTEFHCSYLKLNLPREFQGLYFLFAWINKYMVAYIDIVFVKTRLRSIVGCSIEWKANGITVKSLIPVSSLEKVESFVRFKIIQIREKNKSQKYFFIVNTSIVMFLFKSAHTFYLARKKIETKWLITNKDNVRHFFRHWSLWNRAPDYIAVPLWNFADYLNWLMGSNGTNFAFVTDILRDRMIRLYAPLSNAHWSRYEKICLTFQMISFPSQSNLNWQPNLNFANDWISMTDKLIELKKPNWVFFRPVAL